MAGVYVHIPFCKSKCGYCDFHSIPRLQLAGDYVDALLCELRARVDRPVSTVYIGGGTPSALPLSELSRLLSELPSEGVEEFTIEVNPDDVTREFADFLAQSPVNRVSMGVQSLVDAELKAAGRRHDAAGAVEACRRLREAGIANISLDLIYGLPLQTLESWRYSLSQLIALGPKHVSAYMLSIEEGTRFFAMRQAGKLTEASEDTLTLMYAEMCYMLAEAGYEHYEISNFSQPGYRARHNSSYWSGADYIGLGTGAHSFVDGVRGSNPPDVARYIRQHGADFFEREEETDDNRFNTMVITRLRTSDGLDLGEMETQFGPGSVRRLLADADPYLSSGRMTREGSALKIKEDAWLVSDSILVDLIR